MKVSELIHPFCKQGGFGFIAEVVQGFSHVKGGD